MNKQKKQLGQKNVCHGGGNRMQTLTLLHY